MCGMRNFGLIISKFLWVLSFCCLFNHGIEVLIFCVVKKEYLNLYIAICIKATAFHILLQFCMYILYTIVFVSLNLCHHQF